MRHRGKSRIGPNKEANLAAEGSGEACLFCQRWSCGMLKTLHEGLASISYRSRKDWRMGVPDRGTAALVADVGGGLGS